MNNKSYKQKIFGIFKVALLSIGIVIMSIFVCCKNAYATSFNDPLSESEMVEIKKYDSLVKMIGDIYSFNVDNGTAELTNVETLLYNLVDKSITHFFTFTNTRLYRYIQATALLFLMINFMLNIFGENSIGYEEGFLSKKIFKQYALFVIVLILIITIRTYVMFIMGFFRFLLQKVIEMHTSNELGEVQNISNTINTNRVVYNILNESGLVGSEVSAIEEVAIRAKEASLRSMYMFPWIGTWIGKVGQLIIIFTNTVSLIIYGIFYSISVTDTINDLKKSKFLNYSKHLTALAVQEVVIVVVMYISDLLLNKYIVDLLEVAKSGSLSYLNIAIIITSISISKCVLLIGTFSLSKRLMGVV